MHFDSNYSQTILRYTRFF